MYTINKYIQILLFTISTGLLFCISPEKMSLDEVNTQIDEQQSKVQDLTQKNRELQQNIDDAQKEKDRLAQDRLKIPIRDPRRQAIEQGLLDQTLIINDAKKKLTTVQQDLDSSQKELDTLDIYKDQLLNAEISSGDQGTNIVINKPIQTKGVVSSILDSLVSTWDRLASIFSTNASLNVAKRSFRQAQDSLVAYENKLLDARTPGYSKVASWNDRIALQNNASKYGKEYEQLVKKYSQLKDAYADKISNAVIAEDPYRDAKQLLKNLPEGSLNRLSSILKNLTPESTTNNYLNNRYKQLFGEPNPYEVLGIPLADSFQYTMGSISSVYQSEIKDEPVDSLKRKALDQAYKNLRENKALIDSNIAQIDAEHSGYVKSYDQAIDDAKDQNIAQTLQNL